jgi:hypothetical protein
MMVDQVFIDMYLRNEQEIITYAKYQIQTQQRTSQEIITQLSLFMKMSHEDIRKFYLIPAYIKELQDV